MGYDSVLINTQIPKITAFDAIVIGTGITGGYAAMKLCQAGMKVLCIERGRNQIHGRYPTENKAPWQLPHRGRLTRAQLDAQPVQRRHFSFREETAHYYVDDQVDKYVEENRYDWIRPDVVGGRSLLWGRASFRWSDYDFEANLRDGHGVDWPIRYADLAPWYSEVEKFIGISGSREGIASIPDGEFLPPFELTCADEFLKGNIEKAFPERRVIMARIANLTQAHHGRTACQARNQCDRGCTFAAYFSSNSVTLPAAAATGNLTLITGAHVAQIHYDESRQMATGVEIIDRQTLKTYRFSAPLIFLNASTIASAALLLNSKSSRFPNGLGNDSDQVGRNLMDHHKGVWGHAAVPGMRDKTYYGRRPYGLFMPAFRNRGSDKSAFLRSYIVNLNTSRSRNNQPGIGAAMKADWSEPGPWTVSMGAYGECLPYPDNRLTLSSDQQDRLGMPLIKIDCRFRENEKAMQQDMESSIYEMLEKAGCEAISMDVNMSYPGNSNHEMGTIRMGHDPKTSVLNKWNQVHAVKNLFVTDGSCMTSNGSANPSLTYLALTARACDYAIGLRKVGGI